MVSSFYYFQMGKNGLTRKTKSILSMYDTQSNNNSELGSLQLDIALLWVVILHSILNHKWLKHWLYAPSSWVKFPLFL